MIHHDTHVVHTFYIAPEGCAPMIVIWEEYTDDIRFDGKVFDNPLALKELTEVLDTIQKLQGGEV